MNRDIKFRGKVKGSNEWVRGSLIVWNDGEHNIYVPGKHNYKVDTLNVDPNTVGQFTGLLDKNGNEIYEGDVVSYTDFFTGEMITPVQYLDGAMCVENGAYLLSEYAEESLVVGNIYDNPDLLNGGGVV